MRFIINGGKALSGDIKLKGFKNSATPIIAATILSDKPCLLKNIPRIGDALKILEIMKVAGSKQK
jgi:UDP-N-acetylglucosamine 1-carboxyvinyltransferase